MEILFSHLTSAGNFLLIISFAECHHADGILEVSGKCANDFFDVSGKRNENLNDKKSYLKSDKKVIIMCGFFEDSHLCYHLQLTNMHSTPVIFNVESPRGRAFGATPHVGVIMPQCKTTIYCTFRSERVSRIPDDGIYIYSIFQKAINADKFINAQNDKEKERIARKIWSQHRGKCFECLRLPVGFEPRRPAAHEQHVELCPDIAPGQVEYTKPKLSKEEMPTSQMPSAEEIR